MNETEAKAAVARFRELFDALQREIHQLIVGQDDVVDGVLTALFAGGHVLLEGVPGIGKTMLVKTLGDALHLSKNRIQFTPDLMPADVVGTMVLESAEGSGAHALRFQPGPIHAHILLADEINRATPRAQSALLECMEEFRVSVDGIGYELPAVFMVLATQNPIDMAGTHPLPEAQLDRFFVRLPVGYPDLDEEVRILAAQAQAHPIDTLQPIVGEAEVLAARDAVKTVHVAADVARYMARISAATRTHRDLRLGVSPRGTLALARGSQGMALLRGREFVTPDIVKAMAGAVLEHRLIVRPHAAANGRTARDILAEILDRLPPPV